MKGLSEEGGKGGEKDGDERRRILMRRE